MSGDNDNDDYQLAGESIENPVVLKERDNDKLLDDPLANAKRAFSKALKELIIAVNGNDGEREVFTQFGEHITRSLQNAKPEIFSDYHLLSSSDSPIGVRTSARPTRVPGLAAKKKFFAKKRNRSELVHDLLTSSDSLLCGVPLMMILNSTTFNSMIPAREKDNFLKLLPKCDTGSHENVSAIFTNPEFLHSLMLFQRHLHSGTFDTGDVGNYRRAKKTREMEPWKASHFEHLWGQRLLSDILLEEPVRNSDEPIPFSYTDPALLDLAIFAEPVVTESNRISIHEVRESLIGRDTSNLFSFIYPPSKMDHYRRRKLVLHRNPAPELFVRCTNITSRRENLLDYGTIKWTPMNPRKWNSELGKIRNVQGYSPITSSGNNQSTQMDTCEIPTPPESSSAVEEQELIQVTTPSSYMDVVQSPPTSSSSMEHKSINMELDLKEVPILRADFEAVKVLPNSFEPTHIPSAPPTISKYSDLQNTTLNEASVSRSNLDTTTPNSDDEFVPEEDEPLPIPEIKENPITPKKSKIKAKSQTSQYKKKEKVSFRTVAYDVLKKEMKPLPAKEIVFIALRDKLFTTSGKTPENTLASVLYKDIQLKKDPPSLFVRLNLKPVAFALREWNLHLSQE